MHAFEVNRITDFAVYKQVVRGAYNPVTVMKPVFKSALSLVRSANTCVVCSAADKNEVERFISSADLTSYGYHSTDDIELSYVFNDKLNVYNAVLMPRIVYPLSEDIALPDPPSEKARIFLNFIADQFERVKIRAEHMMDSASPVVDIRPYACRNLQLLRKLFHESRIAFYMHSSSTSNTIKQDDLYIFYILNLFIIRCLVFHTKFFAPFLNEAPPSETDLRNALKNELPRVLKFPWLFLQHPPIYEVLAEYNRSFQVNEINPAYKSQNPAEKPEIPEELITEALDFLQLKGCIKLNCNINVFLNEIFKMRTEKKFDGLPMITAEKKNLMKLFSFCTIDEDDLPLSQGTINSVLKPSNILKRPGKNNTTKSKKVSIDKKNNTDTASGKTLS